MRLGRDFFERDVLLCARELIGCEMVLGECRGRIVETEAYAELGDEACHTFMRESTRQFIANHSAGTAYVYQNYGIHWLFNVLTKGPSGNGFVLVRALAPLEGIVAMRRRRGVEGEKNLCSGPGKLTVAMGFGREFHGKDICQPGGVELVFGKGEVETDVRIGISRAKEKPWRFLERASPWVSVKPKKTGATS